MIKVEVEAEVEIEAKVEKFTLNFELNLLPFLLKLLFLSGYEDCWELLLHNLKYPNMKKFYVFTCIILTLNFLTAQQNVNWSWARSGNGIDDGSDGTFGTCVDASGNVFITGAFTLKGITFSSPSNTVTLMNSDTLTDEMFVAKYDAMGNLLWANSAMGNGDHDRGLSVAVDPAGNSYVTGYFKSPTIVFDTYTLTNNSQTGLADIFVVKYGPAGNVIWAHRFGGALEEWGMDIVADAGGNTYLTGFFNSLSVSFGSVSVIHSGNGDAYTAKLDPNGVGIWAQQAGSSLADGAWAITMDISGNVYVAGSFESSSLGFSPNLINNGGSDVFFVKYDGSNGGVLYAKSFGGSGNEDVWDIDVDLMGNAYLAGRYDSNPLVIGTTTLSRIGSKDFYTAAFNSLGNPIWAKRHIGNTFSSPTSVNADLLGNVYVSGHLVNVLPTTVGNTTLSGTGGTNGATGGYIIKYLAATGTDLWNTTFKAHPEQADLDLFGNIYMGGSYNPTVVLGPDTLGGGFQTEAFVAKICNLPVITGTDVTICAGLNGSINVTVPPGFIPNWFNAATGGSLILPGSGSLTSSSSGTFFIELTDTIAGCGFTGPRIGMSITILPGASVSVAGGSLTTNIIDSVSIYWYDCIYGTIVANTPTFFPNVPGSYAVIITADNCVDTSDCFAFPPVIISENFQKNAQLKIFPNPNNGSFMIQVNTSGKYEVINPMGETIRTVELKENEKIELTDLSSGVYFITDGRIREKVVVTR
jgi:hypothetical protein